MSEERFRVCCDDDLGDMWVVDIATDEEYWTALSLVDLLNNLNDDVKHLEEYSADLEADVKRFQKENERLKGEVENLQSNMMESLGKHRKYEKSLEEGSERKTNEIKLLRKAYSKVTDLNKANKMLKLQTYCQDQYIKKLELEQKALLEQLETQNI